MMERQVVKTVLTLLLTASLSYVAMLIPNLGENPALAIAVVLVLGAPVYAWSSVGVLAFCWVGSLLSRINQFFVFSAPLIATAVLYALYSRHDLYVNEGASIFPGGAWPPLVVLWLWAVKRARDAPPQRNDDTTGDLLALGRDRLGLVAQDDESEA